LYQVHKMRDSNDKKICYKGKRLSVAEFVTEATGDGSSLFYNKVNAGLCYDVLFRANFSLEQVPHLLTTAQILGSIATATREQKIRLYSGGYVQPKHIPEIWKKCIEKYPQQPSLKELKAILDEICPHYTRRRREPSLKEKFDKVSHVFLSCGININQVINDEIQGKVIEITDDVRSMT
jgi:hypothetical protein